MKIPPTLALTTLTAANSNSTFHDPLTTPTNKRAYLTCVETYGGGSTICGDPSSSHFCYDPSLGDVFPLSLFPIPLLFKPIANTKG
jgi:hypothetical protein